MNRRLIFLGVAVVGLTLSLTIYAAAQKETSFPNGAKSRVRESAKELNQKRIVDAERRIEYFRTSAPDQTVQLTLSFHTPLPIDQVESLLASHPGRVSHLWHGYVARSNVFRGGYMLGENETLADARHSYRTTFLRELELQLADLKGQPEAQTDAAMKRLIVDLEDRLRASLANGTQIFGVAIKGRAADLITFAEKLPMETVLELTETAQARPALFFAGGDL